MALRRYDARLLDLVDAAAENIQRSTRLLRELLEDYPERAELAREVFECEQEGDRIAHDIIHRLNGGRRAPRAPFDAADGHALATAIDDIVDYAEQAADTLGIYGVEAPMEQALALADVFVEASREVARALGTLREDGDMGGYLVEIHRLENEGDRISRDAVAALFRTGIDPMVVIRWKDIFAALEAGVDACETVAHLLEGISVKRRR
jgi:predicted phosphate transport protein (TIGR00153 family)